MSHRRVVITGLGWVTSLGVDVDQVFQRMCQGHSGVRTITRFDASRYPTRIAAEVDWDGGPNLDKRESKRLDRFAQFALNAAIDAVNDSGVDFSKEDPYRCGSIFGTGIGGIEEFETGYQKLLEKGPDRVSPFMVPKLMCNAGSGNISIYWGLKGPNYAAVSACASAAHAIADAATAIRENKADVMVTGGSEAAVTPLGTACFVALKALSTRNDEPTLASRPFDAGRDGFVLGEGGGVLVLEEYEHAKARGARIHAELLGWGQSNDGNHITAPDAEGRGAAYAMKSGLEDAGVGLEDVGYINAHGTSTPLGDVAEVTAIKRIFGDRAKLTPVSSTKSMIGHSLGASGAIEAIACIKSLNEGILHPTINQTDPDEACDLDVVPNTAREVKIKVAISNSFGFGGHNVCLVMGKP